MLRFGVARYCCFYLPLWNGEASSVLVAGAGAGERERVQRKLI